MTQTLSGRSVTGLGLIDLSAELRCAGERGEMVVPERLDELRGKLVVVSLRCAEEEEEEEGVG